MKKLLFIAICLFFGVIAYAQEPAQSPTFEKSQKSMIKFMDKLKAVGFEISDEEYPKILAIYTETYEVMVKCTAENKDDKAAANECSKPAVQERTKKFTALMGAERAKLMLSMHKAAHAYK